MITQFLNDLPSSVHIYSQVLCVCVLRGGGGGDTDQTFNSPGQPIFTLPPWNI